MDNKALGLLGLCARAGKIVSGEAACDQAIKKKTAFLVLMDEAASANSKKALCDACAYYGVPHDTLPGGMLGQAIGKPGRMAAAITDQTLGRRLADLLNVTIHHIECEKRGGACRE